nr:unnamed protein product [Haemonchus contortus]
MLLEADCQKYDLPVGSTVLAGFIYVLETLAVIGFLITKPPTELVVIGAFIILFGYFFFSFISRAGARLMKGIEGTEELKRAVIEAWGAIDEEHLQNLVFSMPRKLLDVALKQGGAIDY